MKYVKLYKWYLRCNLCLTCSLGRLNLSYIIIVVIIIIKPFEYNSQGNSCTGNGGKGVTVQLHADLIMQMLVQCRKDVCWIIIYKVSTYNVHGFMYEYSLLVPMSASV